MKLRRLAKLTAIFGAATFYLTLVMIASAGAQQTAPSVVPVKARIASSPATVFRSIRNHLTARFTLTADPVTGKIIAKRSGLDPDTWTTWAYCKVPTQDMLGDMTTSSVVLKITITAARGHSSEVIVGADFQATYSINGQPTPVGCISNDVLENEILDSAGARIS